jgi:hypothetical protein
MNILKVLLVLSILILLNSCGIAQRPYLGDTKADVKEMLLITCKNHNDYESYHFKNDGSAIVADNGDTLVFRISDSDELKYIFTFSNDKCETVQVKLACFVCLHQGNGKWLFQGKWRVDENGYLYRRKDSARAYIKRSVDCPFLYEVVVQSLNSPIAKENWRNMRKVKKSEIATRKYLLKD